MENNELYHHGVLGMKWGHRKSGLEMSRDHYKRKASVAFSKSMLSATKASNARLKYINPTYYLNRHSFKKQRAKYNKYKSISQAAQLQIDLNDPIEHFFNKMDNKVDAGLNWCESNASAKKYID